MKAAEPGVGKFLFIFWVVQIPFKKYTRCLTNALNFEKKIMTLEPLTSSPTPSMLKNMGCERSAKRTVDGPDKK